VILTELNEFCPYCGKLQTIKGDGNGNFSPCEFVICADCYETFYVKVRRVISLETKAVKNLDDNEEE